MNAQRPRRVLTIALAAVALAATFGIGLLVGREIARPPAAAPSDPSAVLDLSPYAGVAPELLTYRVLVEVPVTLEKPRGIASAADGTIFVCGDRSLLALDRGGGVKNRWDLDGEPSCVATGPEGTLYVGMPDHVEVIRPGMAGTIAWPDLGSQAIVTSVAVVGSDVFVADAGNRMVLRFDAGGRLTGTVGSGYGVPSPYFDVAGSPDGTLWVAIPVTTLCGTSTPTANCSAPGGPRPSRSAGSAVAATPCTSPCAPAARSSPQRRGSHG